MKSISHEIVNSAIFLTSFAVKLVMQILILIEIEFLSKESFIAVFLDYAIGHVVILNLYYFTYRMMKVWDRLESKSPEMYVKLQKRTNILMYINIGFHALIVVIAAVIIYLLMIND